MSDFECPICLTDFCLDPSFKKRPTLLANCGHNVCECCLDGLTSQGGRLCPVCRSPLTVTSKNLFLERKMSEKSRKRQRDLETVGSSVGTQSAHVEVWKTLQTMPARKTMSMIAENNCTGQIFTANILVSGVMRTNGHTSFLLLESNKGYLSMVDANGCHVLSWQPVQQGMCLYRASEAPGANAYLALRSFPDYATDCKLDPMVSVPLGSLVVGECRTKGTQGDTYVRVHDATSGKGGWLAETRSGVRYLSPIELSPFPAGDRSVLPATPKLDIDEVRVVAVRLGYTEIAHVRESAVVSFRRGEDRVNVYYSTGTLAACLDHPRQGKMQLFWRNRTAEELEEIFGNPRRNIGAGYDHRPNATPGISGRRYESQPPALRSAPLSSSTSSSSSSSSSSVSDWVGSEIYEMRAEVRRLEIEMKSLVGQHGHLSAQLREAREENDRREAEEQRRREEVIRREAEEAAAAKRRKMEEEAKQAAEAEAKRVAEAKAAEERRLAEIAAAEEATRRAAAEALEQRGRRHVAKMPNSQSDETFKKYLNNPQAFATVKHFCFTESGIFYSRDNRRSCWSGLSTKLQNLLEEKNKNVEGQIQYLACEGEGGDYFVRFADGSTAWSVDDDTFCRFCKGSRPISRVALGPNGTWVLIFTDGEARWSKGLPQQLFEQLRRANSSKKKCAEISLGQDSNYFVKFANGTFDYSLDDEIHEAIQNLKSRGHTVCNVFLGGSWYYRGWLVRYR